MAHVEGDILPVGMLEWERKSGESGEMYKRFVYYLELGQKRTLRQVAEDYGLSVAAVHNMAAKWKWTKRVAAYEERQTEERILALTDASKAATQQLIRIADKMLTVAERKLETVKSDDAAWTLKTLQTWIQAAAEIKAKMLGLGGKDSADDNKFEFIIRHDDNPALAGNEPLIAIEGGKAKEGTA